ncbi:hypothetical protein A3K73_03810 [Candidatus Pacearchaeota archaeon RBG_13_36_9]|nr:MAG: hypothetical protein A3K73_03810 [Candidatus Pacearchaeota archaeon RBG_13_36_9]
MSITKKGGEIIEFECFHLECWKRFFQEAVERGIRERVREYEMKLDMKLKTGGKGLNGCCCGE